MSDRCLPILMSHIALVGLFVVAGAWLPLAGMAAVWLVLSLRELRR